MNTAKQLTLEFENRPSVSGDDFLVAPANENAVSWVDRWPEWPTPAITISGPAGCGKTHLCHVFMAKSNASMVDITKSPPEEIRAIVENNKALVIDDADQISKPDQEETLFHFLNVLKETGHTALLTSTTPPARWNVNLPDLQSRLNALPHAAISDPDDPLIAAVLVKLFSDRQLKISAEVVDYILPRLERSFDSVTRTVDAIDNEALTQHRKITIPLARSVMDHIGE